MQWGNRGGGTVQRALEARPTSGGSRLSGLSRMLLVTNLLPYSRMISIPSKRTGRSGGQTAGGDSKAFPQLKQPLFAVPLLRELRSACSVSILRDAVTVPTVCFSGLSEGRRGGGQQQFATRTLCVHLLGLEYSLCQHRNKSEGSHNF